MTTVARRDPADKAKIDAIEKKLLANPEIAKLIDELGTLKPSPTHKQLDTLFLHRSRPFPLPSEVNCRKSKLEMTVLVLSPSFRKR